MGCGRVWGLRRYISFPGYSLYFFEDEDLGPLGWGFQVFLGLEHSIRINILWNTGGREHHYILLHRITFNPSPIPIKWLTRSATPTNLSHIFQHNALSTNLWCLSNYNNRHDSIPYLTSHWQFCHYIPYRTKWFIGINVCEIRDCQNRQRFKPTKSYFQQVLFAWEQLWRMINSFQMVATTVTDEMSQNCAISTTNCW